MKLNEITGKEKATSTDDLITSVENGVFTKDGSRLAVEEFFCIKLGLRSLEGCPQDVQGTFDCSNNFLTSLVGGPQIVRVNYFCQKNQLTSLIGCPKKVGNYFSCKENKLTSLEGGLEEVDGSFNLSGNRLTSLKDVHKHIKIINGNFYLTSNPIKSHVLGLLKIQKLSSVDLDHLEVQKIINKYLPLGDLLDCQEELIEAGFEEYAQL